MKVASFTVDHDKMGKGIYVSRKDPVGGEILTTFDLRMKTPNSEPVLDNPGIHTLEHLLAVYLRTYSGDWEERVIYVGPMGCRTGMYLIIRGDMEPMDILGLLRDAFGYAANFSGPVPATTSKECGHYRDHSLEQAKAEASAYLTVLNHIKPENMVYPQ